MVTNDRSCGNAPALSRWSSARWRGVAAVKVVFRTENVTLRLLVVLSVGDLFCEERETEACRAERCNSVRMTTVLYEEQPGINNPCHKPPLNAGDGRGESLLTAMPIKKCTRAGRSLLHRKRQRRAHHPTEFTF